MPYGNMFGRSQPPTTNALWIGDNYSNGYSQMSRSNYPNVNNQNGMASNNFMMQPQSINNIWQVMGPESAQAYQIGPDSQVILMDSNRPVFYIKKSDSLGYSDTKAFEFQEIPLFQSNPDQQVTNSEYITKTEFEEFKKIIEDLVMKNE